MCETEKKLSEKLKKQGFSGIQLFEKIATRTVELKEKTRENRCPRCWHEQARCCFCSHIPNLTKMKLPIKVIILMHYKEYLSAGNDAKLLLAMMPKHLSELFVFGKEGEWEKFEAECAIDPEHTIMLWPADDALTIDGFKKERLSIESPWNSCNQHKNTEAEEDKNFFSRLPILRVIVLDGVYSQSRSMFRSIKRRFPLSTPVPPYVALHPKTLSVYHRAQNGYSKSSAETIQKSKNPDALHVCTVEAFALLLKEFGESDETTEALVKAVEMNNLAIAHKLK